MATNASSEFEDALKRLEEIVTKLERESVGLDESVELFKEGKGLEQRLAQLLERAKASIEAAARGEAAPATATPPAQARGSRAATPLFGAGDSADL